MSRAAGFALGLLGAACVSEVPIGDAPSGEPCITPSESPDGALYGVIVDGFYTKGCPRWLRTKPNEQAIVLFTGPAWSRSSASCRASNPWFQDDGRNWALTRPSIELDLHGDGVLRPLSIEGGLAPPTALGYCAVNEGQPDEYLVYSTCGIAALGPQLCEQTLPLVAEHAIRTTWHACPNAEDPRCAPSPVQHGCLPALDAIDGRKYARYLDSFDFRCDDGGDGWDSLIVTQGPGWHEMKFECISAQPFYLSDQQSLPAGLDLGPYAGAFSEQGVLAPTPAMGDPELPAPTRKPTGYCEVWPGTRYAYAVFNFCEQGSISPRQRCETGWKTRDGVRPVWHECPVGELCF